MKGEALSKISEQLQNGSERAEKFPFHLMIHFMILKTCLLKVFPMSLFCSIHSKGKVSVV